MDEGGRVEGDRAVEGDHVREAVGRRCRLQEGTDAAAGGDGHVGGNCG